MAPTVVDDRARQGPRGRTVLYVLVASLVLAAVAVTLLLLWSGSQTPPSQSQPVSPGQSSGAASSSNSSSVPSANPAYPAPATNAATPRQ